MFVVFPDPAFGLALGLTSPLMWIVLLLCTDITCYSSQQSMSYPTPHFHLPTATILVTTARSISVLSRPAEVHSSRAFDGWIFKTKLDFNTNYTLVFCSAIAEIFTSPINLLLFHESHFLVFLGFLLVPSFCALLFSVAIKILPVKSDTVVNIPLLNLNSYLCISLSKSKVCLFN